MLPIGFCDLLDSEAKNNQENIDVILKKFYEFNYNIIKTPLIEFAADYQDNQKIFNQSFKLIDPLSGQTLLVRSDITSQIARLFSTKLKNKKLPIKLCYVGDVLKTKNEDLHANRQSTQSGIELIGDQSLVANQEVIDITLQALRNTNISNILIDFCLPKFLDYLFMDLEIKDNGQLKIALEEKNITKIRKLGGKFAPNLANLVLQANDIDAIKVELSNLPISKKNQEKIENLKTTIDNVKRNNPELEILINIFSDLEFLYHEEIGFTILDSNSNCLLARGGKYLINDKIPAIGSTIYINNLRRSL